MIAMLGLSFDLGRMFISKNELQTFADAAALAAATELMGGKAGVQQAYQVAQAGPLGTTRPNGVNFETSNITNVAANFSTALNGTYDSYATASGPNTNTYRFVRVTATANVPFYFLPVLPNIGLQQSLSASAVAGQNAGSGFGYGGLTPFSPSAHNASDTHNFGLTPGQRYTFKWGNGNSTTCPGDAGFNPGNAPSAHGFVDLGQGNGNSDLRDVITYGGYPNPSSNPSSVTAGTVLYSVPGNRGSSIFGALAERSLQDPDQTSTTYADYQTRGTGNNRRIVSAAIHDPALNSGNGSNFRMTVVGFGNFLIDPASMISGSSGPICATYIGPASTSGASSGGTDGTKVYAVLLYQ